MSALSLELCCAERGATPSTPDARVYPCAPDTDGSQSFCADTGDLPGGWRKKSGIAAIVGQGFTATCWVHTSHPEQTQLILYCGCGPPNMQLPDDLEQFRCIQYGRQCRYVRGSDGEDGICSDEGSGRHPVLGPGARPLEDTDGDGKPGVANTWNHLVTDCVAHQAMIRYELAVLGEPELTRPLGHAQPSGGTVCFDDLRLCPTLSPSPPPPSPPPTFPPFSPPPPPSPPLYPSCTEIQPEVPFGYVGRPWQLPRCFMDSNGGRHCVVLPEGQTACDPEVQRRLRKHWNASVIAGTPVPNGRSDFDSARGESQFTFDG